MSQLKVDTNYPFKELSRSSSHPQEPDIDTLKHLLKHVNQIRDFVFVLDPQVPAQRTHFCSDCQFSDCQKSRCSTSRYLLTMLEVNVSSTSRTQTSISHSSAEAELYAMTQASVESLAIKHFIQNSGHKFFRETSRLCSRQILQQARQEHQVLASHTNQSTLSSSFYEFKTFSVKGHLTRESRRAHEIRSSCSYGSAFSKIQSLQRPLFVSGS